MLTTRYQYYFSQLKSGFFFKVGVPGSERVNIPLKKHNNSVCFQVTWNATTGYHINKRLMWTRELQSWTHLPGFHIPPTYLLQVSAMDHRPNQVGTKCKSNILVQISTIPSRNMELWENRAVKSYITSADDVHIKYFHRRQSPTTTGQTMIPRWMFTYTLMVSQVCCGIWEPGLWKTAIEVIN